MAIVSSALGILLGIGFPIFLIAGMTLRWGHVGRVCSGVYVGTAMDTDPLEPDENVYMESTGKFMHWYLIIIAIIFAILLILALLCCLCMCGIIGVGAGAAALSLNRIRNR